VRVVSFVEHSFKVCLQRDPDLAALREEYARKPAKKRRLAAQWEYDSSIAGRIFNQALERAGQPGLGGEPWPDGVVALAIDPLFAPAILTVGSIEYQLGRRDEAMELFLTLTTLPAEEPDLAVIIDKAADFLLCEKDPKRARDLYAAAEKSFPTVAVYPAGLSYCLGRLQLYEEAVAGARRSDELEPENYVRLNDLGWALYQAGYLAEALATLQRAVRLAPRDDTLALNNLETVRQSFQATPQARPASAQIHFWRRTAGRGIQGSFGLTR
jgi:tetratricopeptide (TPR) repeat protein